MGFQIYNNRKAVSSSALQVTIEWNVLGQTDTSGCEGSPTLQGVTLSPSSGCCWWGRSQSLKYLRTFKFWRGCLPQNISLNSVASRA